ncbi:MAG: GspE/PulE family protein [Acidobacteriota bacterium]|nr:GspE/PulE family protein [Blastocatellia bacterium]MDW8240706.1 GspE/PulE family protein [Acidobacteriota bacterium]
MSTEVNFDALIGGPDTAAAPPETPEQEQARARQLAERYRLPFVDLTQVRLDQELLHVLPVEVMIQYRFVPLRRENGHLVIAIADPTALDKVDEIASRLRSRVKLAVATPSAIDAVLTRGDASQRVLDETTQHLRVSLVRETDQGEEDLDLDRLTGDKQMSPIVKLVDSVVLTALERRASDIHIETRANDVFIKYRIDGALYPAGPPIDIQHHQTIISRIKVMSELDIAERRVPQDGRFRVRVRGRTIDFRVSIMPTIHGEDAVIRILDKEQINEQFRDLRLSVLGFEEDDLARFRRFIKEPYGMILVTGPTGSGKTTTLYASLNEIRNEEDKIITLEDPVEYQLQGVTQIQVNEKKGLTFARGLRSILRHDPDKIMVGEIRDSETAQIAIQSALTGHLVFTTVHANNVIDVIGRFLNMGVEPYNFVGALNCVLAQRLVRVLCSQCKRTYRPTDQELVESGLNPEQYRHYTYYEIGGCDACNWTGYRGRTAIHELLDMSDTIRELIIERRPGSEIRRAAQAEGLRSLRQSAVRKVLAGVTTLREINRVTFVE